MASGRSRGFTLIEIMLVVGLVGIIAVGAVTPLIYTIRSMEEAQERWGVSHNSSDAAARLFSDVRRVVPNPSFGSFRIIHKSSFGSNADDRLVIWSAAPKYEGKNVGVVIYKIVAKDAFSDAKPGLYRWVLANVPSEAAVSGDNSSGEEKGPMDTDTDKLDPKDGTMVLSDASSLALLIRKDDEWKHEYEGDLPKMLRIEIGTPSGVYSETQRFPNGA